MNSKLRTILTHLAAVALGWFLSSVFGSCNRAVTPGTVAGKPADTYVISARTDTITRDSIIYRDRWHTRTESVVIYDTSGPLISSYAYVRQASATTSTHDTIDVAYHHPEGLFDIGFRPHPDTVRTITITNDTVVGISDSRKWGIGFHAGIGAQRASDGIVRAGVQIGVGVNFNVWEP